MRTGAVTAARPQFYDRSAATNVLAFDQGGVAPHGDTIRATYTVPVNKKAWMDTVFMRTERTGAAAPVAVVRVSCRYTPSGGSSVLLAHILHRDNTLAIDRTSSLTAMGYLSTGDTVALHTSDSSTGGANDYTLAAKFTEFDA